MSREYTTGNGFGYCTCHQMRLFGQVQPLRGSTEGLPITAALPRGFSDVTGMVVASRGEPVP